MALDGYAGHCSQSGHSYIVVWGIWVEFGKENEIADQLWQEQKQKLKKQLNSD